MSTNSGQLPPFTREVTQQRIAAYADVSGDHNPIHLDPEFAAGTQFGGVVAHGMLLYGFLCDAMKRAHPESWDLNGRMRSRFREPARPGNVVTITGSRVETVSDGDLSSIVRYSLECRNSDGQVLASGSAEVTIATDSSSAG